MAQYTYTGASMRHTPNEICECHDCHVARRVVPAAPVGVIQAANKVISQIDAAPDFARGHTPYWFPALNELRAALASLKAEPVLAPPAQPASAAQGQIEALARKHGQTLSTFDGLRVAFRMPQLTAFAAELGAAPQAPAQPGVQFIKGWDACRQYEGLSGSVESDNAMRQWKAGQPVLKAAQPEATEWTAEQAYHNGRGEYERSQTGKGATGWQRFDQLLLVNQAFYVARAAFKAAQPEAVSAQGGDAVREALRLAVRQNSHDMVMTGEEIRQCEAALSQPIEAAPAAVQASVAPHVSEKDAARWRYAIADGGNQRMNWMDVYDDWDGDGDFTTAIDAAIATHAGRDWSQDCFTQGVGKPIGWLPMLDAPAVAAEPVAEIMRRVRRIAELCAEDQADHYHHELRELERALAAPAVAVPLTVTDEMALAFHRATSDGSVNQNDLDEIKTGLRAAHGIGARATTAPALTDEQADACIRAQVFWRTLSRETGFGLTPELHEFASAVLRAAAPGGAVPVAIPENAEMKAHRLYHQMHPTGVEWDLLSPRARQSWRALAAAPDAPSE